MMRTRYVILGAVPLAALAALAGRASVRPEVREVVRTDYVDRVVTQTVREEAKATERVVYRDRIITPDGTVREQETERELARALVIQHAATESAREVHTAQRTDVPLAAPQPRWRVSALVGAPVRLAPGPVLVGVHIQRRLWGPVTAGAWTLAPVRGGTPASVGVSVGVEF